MFRDKNKRSNIERVRWKKRLEKDVNKSRGSYLPNGALNK